MKALLVVYDNDSHINYFPLGIGYLAAAIRDQHEVHIYNQDIHHYPEPHLTEYLDNNDFDFVGLSFIGGYYQYHKAVKIAQAINASKNRPFFMVGGHGPAPEPEFFMRKLGADAVGIGEGEETLKEVLATLEAKRSLADVRGIAYMDGEVAHVNPRRELIKCVDSIRHPAYDLFPMELYRLSQFPHMKRSDFALPMLSGRGCPFECNFCFRLDKGFRPRSNESIIEEIKLLQKDYAITYIAFFDELLMSSEERVTSFCESLLKANLGIRWDCNGRLNYAKPDLLKLMKKAGCVFVNYGIECVDDTVLKRMHKALTVRQIVSGIEATLDAGLSPGLNIIFGNHGENRETLQRGVDFLLKYDDGAQLRTIRPVTPYPGCELYYDAIKAGKIVNCQDFYDNKHTNSDLLSVNFTELSDDDFYDALRRANGQLLENYIERQRVHNRDVLDGLYLKKNANFRGFRKV